MNSLASAAAKNTRCTRSSELGRDNSSLRSCDTTCAARGKNLRTASAMNGSIYTTTAQQRSIGRVDDGIDFELRDVADGDLNATVQILPGHSSDSSRTSHPCGAAVAQRSAACTSSNN